MQIIEWPQFLDSGLPVKEKLSSMTVGVFDGVHRGHQALIERVVSHNSNVPFGDFVPVVITFRENHKTGAVKICSEKSSHRGTEARRHGEEGDTVKIVSKEDSRRDAEARRTQREEFGFSDILTFEQKTKILAGMGVEILLVVNFTESFRHMPGIEFLEILIKRGNVGFFAVGCNFRCGYKLDTDAAAIKSFFEARNVPAEIVPEVMEGGLPISSSRIRSCLASGDIQQAQIMLGRQY
jgi:riboflavin kinase/FMN adenylyltransferase